MVPIYMTFTFYLGQAENKSLKWVIPDFDKFCEPIKQSDWMFGLTLELIRENLTFKQMPKQQEGIVRKRFGLRVSSRETSSGGN